MGPQLDWLGQRPYPVAGADAQIVILDTVIATGGTILKICNEIQSRGEVATKCITIIACYVSPTGLAGLTAHPLVREMVVAAKAESVDDNGYVVPYPGDIGDKLYGKAHE